MKNFDPEIQKITDYCFSEKRFSDDVLNMAKYALMDAMSCAMLSLKNPHCLQHITPLLNQFGLNPENRQRGIIIPGTAFKLDLFQASYVISSMTRWLDYNDTWLAKEWGHPSDNIGAIISAMIFTQQNTGIKFTMADMLDAIIRAYEIQGVLALDNSFNKAGYDHVVLVRLASAALTIRLMGGTKQQCNNALSNVFMDGACLRAYRHTPNTGWRKSWAAGDASRQGVYHAFQALNGEMGYPTALTAEQWGFNHVILRDRPLLSSNEYSDYVMHNILYKIAYPIEFHAQTAVECAIHLHKIFKEKYQINIDNIKSINISTHEAAMRIINKTGTLNNPADRDHCIQYGIAVALLDGQLESYMFADAYASNTTLDKLRGKMQIQENPEYTRLYFDSNKRAIANKIKILYIDGQSEEMEIHYPLGHRERRNEAIPLLVNKFNRSINECFDSDTAKTIENITSDIEQLKLYPVEQWLSLWKK
ncbi:MAG TPA: bifunctional 2-methylcitrate dehydratase/aconitate hydratase [Gammaproteobacteria bacterium]|nr:bifunctional 2-methylcitrate dehydratase/aconitate hydratase [Gammaproteobacteria bacterium]